MTKTHKTLPPPFPGAPTGPHAKHEVKITRKGKLVLLQTFAATYSAKKFLDIVLGKDKPSWLKDKGKSFIALEDIDIEIHCDELEDIIEHEYSKDEAAWTLPEPYPQTALRARGQAPAKSKSATQADREAIEREDGDIPDTEGRSVKKTGITRQGVQAAVEKSERRSALTKKKSSLQREVPKGMITIASICTDLKIEPRVARAILRKNDAKKTDGGWYWDKAGAAKIEAMLKKATK